MFPDDKGINKHSALIMRLDSIINKTDKKDNVCINYYKFVCVALVIQHTKCMCHIILSSVACPAIPQFSTKSHKWNNF